MPELPDVEIYVERLRALFAGEALGGVRLASPFVLRSVEPPPASLHGRRLVQVRRLGKRIVLGFEEELFAVIHLMIAGRLRLRAPRAAIPKGNGLAAFDFPRATLLLTEAGSKRRASLHVVRGEAALGELDRGGLEVLDCTLEAFRARMTQENHTLKRALTDPRILSGIGNAYSDEILLEARLSPFKQTRSLDDAEMLRLYTACRDVLAAWTARLREETGEGFPEKVTAFREGMAVHGRYRRPCPRCGEPVQRIVYADNECNYCARCQTAGRLLADRALSRLLKSNWPRTLEELERA
ncbi:MAG: DNA-formamidopyrimidine glycosylase family protein [Gammaproteobacteria bacterium]|nr:DNA-formamidopyrimidine glycosylase family protein [Gammaproteobacteria bacterium]